MGEINPLSAHFEPSAPTGRAKRPSFKGEEEEEEEEEEGGQGDFTWRPCLVIVITVIKCMSRQFDTRERRTHFIS